MTTNVDASVILLTYKGKVLLLLEENTPIRSKLDVWTFISGVKKKTDSFEKAIIRKVDAEMQIKLPAVAFLSNWTYDGKKKYFYHAQLTDKDVNNIQRSEARTIDFFTLKEIEKMQLDPLTKLFVAKHKDFLDRLCAN